MKRTLTIALVSLVLTTTGVLAQDGAKPAPRPLVTPPAPVVEAPLDPYADPGPPAPAPKAKPAPKKKPAKPKKGQEAPVDPYADPDVAPAPPVAPAKPAGKPKKGAKQAPLDPYAEPATAPPGTPPPTVIPASTSKPNPRLKAPVDPYAEPKIDPKQRAELPVAIPARIGISDLTAVQGLLAVQRLDGWLLFDRDGYNPIAVRLVKPEGNPIRPWFYLLPAKGEPIALVHSAEARSFEHLPGKKLTYGGYRDLDKQLRVMLKGMRSVALEYSPKAAVPSVSRVDAGTVERIRAAGVKVRSSETLVQFTKAIWGDPGRTAHYVAVHHIVELRKDALAFVAKAVHTNQPVTEYDVQQRLMRGMTMRGLVSVSPVVAAGVNSADPYYVPTAAKTAPIKRGDVLVISLALKVDKPEGIWAAQTWVAVVDDKVSEPVAKAFETASLARDQALALIGDRARKRRPVTGSEVDDATRGFIKKSGLADKVMHRTGHSIDTDLQGGGADLDNFEVKDTRILTPGTGFTVGPGLYFAGEFGVRTEVSVYLSPTGPEVTTPAQDDVEAILKR